ncbi:MAG: hypothetical protein H6612_02310 [Ignavibacteriales bacterium]|nr:hypothetical protein [Ignavibacteriales bacterium]MCB9258159.1 hypothetical protein [Ignavibacteriales bacterium]
MELTPDQWAAVLVWGIIILSVAGIILYISNPNLRLKSKKILPPTTTIYGATHEFQPLERREAIEHLNEEQSGKKMQEDETGEPEEK